jgi:hypothetical protein
VREFLQLRSLPLPLPLPLLLLEGVFYFLFLNDSAMESFFFLVFYAMFGAWKVEIFEIND